MLPRFNEDGEWIDEQVTWTNDAETILESCDSREMVRGYIERLPEKYRSVLVLRDIEELDTDEAARSLSVEHRQSTAASGSPGTQDSHRARPYLKDVRLPRERRR